MKTTHATGLWQIERKDGQHAQIKVQNNAIARFIDKKMDALGIREWKYIGIDTGETILQRAQEVRRIV